MATDSLKLEFVRAFLEADVDDNFINALKKELKDFCSNKKGKAYPLRTWESMNANERESFYSSTESQVREGNMVSHEDVKKLVQKWK